MVGVFVAQGHEGRLTRSCDDGESFPYDHSAHDSFRCFVDAEHDCDRSELYRSPDAETWTHQTITPSTISIGPLARSPQGTLVAANDGWQVRYDKQQLFRSSDGVTWTLLDKTAFKGSHLLNFLSFGYVPASPGCGLPWSGATGQRGPG